MSVKETPPKNSRGLPPTTSMPLQTTSQERALLRSRESATLSSRVRHFLATDAPSLGTNSAGEWQEAARSLGPESAPYLIKALQNGSEAQQYSAILALRENGFEAWGHGYNADFEYRVTIDGETHVIKPERYEAFE